MSLSTPSQAPRSISRALEEAARWLKERRERSPRLDAEVLMAHILDCTRTALYARGPELLSEQDLARFRDLLHRRWEGEPVAHLVGWKEFYGRRFLVSPRALIPRPETEFLVEAGLEMVDRLGGPHPEALDLCTGTGAVGLTMALERPDLRVLATDLSREALEVAAENVRRHSPGGRVQLAFGDLFEAVPEGRRFSALVANPPYVGTEQGPPPEEVVSRHEPAMALYAGPDGLEILRRLVAGAPEFLLPGGGLALEVAPWQAEVVEALMQDRGFTGTRLVADLQGFPRIVAGYWEDR